MTLTEPSWHDARRAAHASAERLPVVRVRLADAHGLVTAAPVTALVPLPPLPVSAMDGWAVAGHGPWTVMGELLAGRRWPHRLAAGEAVVIATGAAIPDGAEGVLRHEDGIIQGDRRVHGRLRPGRDIRAAGDEAGAGEVLVPAGVTLTPARIGLAAAAGHDLLAVVRRPRVRVLVLGDELLTHGLPVDGRVRDSLGPQLPAWLLRLGAELVETRHVPDSLGSLVSALAAEDVDLVVTTGGTAAGPVDHLHAAVDASGGSILVDRVDCRPGHPMLLAGWASGRRLVGLPGNPLAAIVALLTLGQPLLDGLAGRPLAALSEVALGGYVATHGAKTRLVPCRLSDGRAVPVDHIGSGMLRGLADADGLVVVTAGEGEPGSPAAWLALP